MAENTPLLDALLEHMAQRPVAFHMPGHKGRCPYKNWPDGFSMDVTELPDTGNLYEGGDAIAQAEELWAEAWGFDACQFLTCGSTQGLHAALLLCARLGKGVLVDRACHRAVYNALALCDLHPAYFSRPQHLPIDPDAFQEAVDEASRALPDLTTVCITSPTYYGVLSDVPALADICHQYGLFLIVDAAHGCHLPFLRDKNPFRGADLVVSSAHKTLPVYGQGALLFSEGFFSADDLRWAASGMGTSSPSYPVMASMDAARAFMESADGLERCRRAIHWALRLKNAFPAITDSIDPMRLTLRVNALAADGFRVKTALEAMGVFPEMADRDHVVFLFSGQNTDEDFQRLFEELYQVGKDWPGVWDEPMTPPLPPEPEVVLSPAQALVARRKGVPLCEAEGMISAVQVAPYPPGVPVIAPGERITKKCLAYLREVGYNVHERHDVVWDEPAIS